ncbi:hypothetical protein [Providencia rettgeri]|uniref:hypothetical protein n=1 Tax=Providencia rettgeri TaxID=587 RepID=UPI0005B37887
MKKAVLLTLFVMLIPLSSQAGSSYYSCEKKLIKLEKEFRSAVSHGNKHKIYKIKKKSISWVINVMTVIQEQQGDMIIILEEKPVSLRENWIH